MIELENEKSPRNRAPLNNHFLFGCNCKLSQIPLSVKSLSVRSNPFAVYKISLLQTVVIFITLGVVL